MALASDYGLGPSTFPRGWFVVAESAELDKRPPACASFLAGIWRYTVARAGSRSYLTPIAATVGTLFGGQCSSAMIVKETGRLN